MSSKRKRDATTSPNSEEIEYNAKKRMLQARLDAALELIDLEVEERIDQFQLSSDMLVSKLEKTFKRQISKLPQKIRSMPLSKFSSEYAGNVQQVMQENATNAQNGASALMISWFFFVCGFGIKKRNFIGGGLFINRAEQVGSSYAKIQNRPQNCSSNQSQDGAQVRQKKRLGQRAQENKPWHSKKVKSIQFCRKS